MDQLLNHSEDTFPYTTFYFIFIYLFILAMQLVGPYFPDQRLNPGPRQWNLRVLTTGLPGNSPYITFENLNKVLIIRKFSLMSSLYLLFFLHSFFLYYTFDVIDK